MSDKKGCTKPDCFPYCDCGSADDYVPATPSEDGGELPEVVARVHGAGWSGLDEGKPKTHWMEIGVEKMPLNYKVETGSTLMFVAQHSRIVAAKDAEIAKFKEANRELGESNVRRRNKIVELMQKLDAQPARQAGGDEREPSACLIRERTKHARWNEQSQCMSEWTEWEPTTLKHGRSITDPKRNTPEVWQMIPLYTSAALAPAAVVMPERSNERGSDGELTYEAKAWNA